MTLVDRIKALAESIGSDIKSIKERSERALSRASITKMYGYGFAPDYYLTAVLSGHSLNSESARAPKRCYVSLEDKSAHGFPFQLSKILEETTGLFCDMGILDNIVVSDDSDNIYLRQTLTCFVYSHFDSYILEFQRIYRKNHFYSDWVETVNNLPSSGSSSGSGESATFSSIKVGDYSPNVAFSIVEHKINGYEDLSKIELELPRELEGKVILSSSVVVEVVVYNESYYICENHVNNSYGDVKNLSFTTKWSPFSNTTLSVSLSDGYSTEEKWRTGTIRWFITYRVD